MVNNPYPIPAGRIPRHLRPVRLYCAWCHEPFAARTWGRRKAGRPAADRYCSGSHRSAAYQFRRRVAAGVA